MDKFVIDTSAIVEEGVLDTFEMQNEEVEVIIPESVVNDLEMWAHDGKPTGWIGLRQLKQLEQFHQNGQITLNYTGSGRTDSRQHARDVARIEGATLITGSKVQRELCLAQSIDVSFIAEDDVSPLSFLEFFDETTMSLHIREGMPLAVKKGRPGQVVYEHLNNTVLTRDDVNEYIIEIVEKAKKSRNAFFEMEQTGGTVIQFENFRIAIATPPFADAFEVTIVRPIVTLTLDDYEMNPELMTRLKEHAEGIIVAGSPGAGKSTFVQALAAFYSQKHKIVKTMESPRDLQVGPEISQYAPLDGDFEKTSDILLLVRPDYTIYDELRKTHDFQIFGDMRLAGVGMIGVTHSSSAIDAIQRFINRIELGMIPQIIDTVIFVKDGGVGEVYELEIAVKVPEGMMEADLARPVVQVRDFFTHETKYEIYSFGDSTTVVPVQGGAEGVPFANLIEDKIASEIKKMGRFPFKVKVLSQQRAEVIVPKGMKSTIVGRGGENVSRLEKLCSIKLDIRVDTDMKKSGRDNSDFKVAVKKSKVMVYVSREHANQPITIFVDGQELLQTKADGKGRIIFTKNSMYGKRLAEAVKKGLKIDLQRM